MAAKKFPKPRASRAVCWGCDLYCPASDMRCGNGRTARRTRQSCLGTTGISGAWRLMGADSADQE